MVTVTSVAKASLAEKKGIVAGDVLLTVNGNEIRDVLDYRFYMTDTHVTLALKRGEETLTVALKKGEYEDVGMDFATPLMDKKHTCANQCIFCFIDQNPKGMRETLYFKDDDDRLSFLHGNYVTLTNLKEKDIDRIIKMHLSPVNISVHTTNPELRVKMMGNKRAGEVLSYLKRLTDAGITLCCQIVLCKGFNDGNELDRTMKDLETLAPNMSSCSVVPFGATKYREGLCQIPLFDKEECREVIRQVNAFGEQCLSKHDSRLFFVADEFYLKAEEPLPNEDYYEGYPQIENGVGLLTSTRTEFLDEMNYLDEYLSGIKLPRTVTLVTGLAAKNLMQEIADTLMKKVKGLTVHVCPIVNHFFGETVTVAGLLTGKDLLEQLKGKDLGDVLLLPSAMLKADEDLFLDGMTPSDLEKAFGVPVCASGNEAADLMEKILKA